MKVSVLATSSAGNCTFVGTDRTRILIDAGLSRRDTFERLRSIGEDPDKLDAILITHEHSDHVCGLGVLSRYYRKLGRAVPVFMTKLTAPLIEWIGDPPPLEHFQAGHRLLDRRYRRRKASPFRTTRSIRWASACAARA